MRFAIVGAGAIGAYLGARLSLFDHDVYLIARGPHLRAMQEYGVRVISPSGNFEAKPTITEDYAMIGEVDFVFLTVKAHNLHEVVTHLDPLLGDETAIVSAQNGIPWWYFYKHGGPLDGWRINSLDPKGDIFEAIHQDRIIGSIVYPSAFIPQPGVVKHVEGNRFSIGELDGSTTRRIRKLADSLVQAGFRCPIRTRIREELWVKLLGNLAFNPISALTRATLVDIVDHPQASSLTRLVMEEADKVAKTLGIDIPISIDRRIAGAGKVGEHKTSMLQDVESGRPIELEAIVGAVIELGDMFEIAMPNTKAVYAMTKLLAERIAKDSA